MKFVLLAAVLSLAACASGYRQNSNCQMHFCPVNGG